MVGDCVGDREDRLGELCLEQEHQISVLECTAALVSKPAKEPTSTTSFEPHLQRLSQLGLIFLSLQTLSDTLAGCNKFLTTFWNFARSLYDEYDDDQFQEVSLGRSAAPSAHLRNSLRKLKIYEMFSFNQISFLDIVIAQFQAKTGKSWTIPAFCIIILKWSLLKSGPAKKKLWNLFRIAFLNPLQLGDTQNRSLMNGAALLLFETQPQLLF